jgi:hypothetical protein
VAYRLRSRQLRRQGEQPPPFLKYLFFPKPLTTKVAVPRATRIVLGVLFLIGGALFFMMAGVFANEANYSAIAHAARAVVVLLTLLVFGVAIGYVGFRLIVVKNDEPLLRRSKSTDTTSSHTGAA